MQSFVREPTKTTPYIVVDYDNGHVTITGVSHPENVFVFYNPVIQAIKEFRSLSHQGLLIDFSLEYFNTSSARCIFLILKELKELESGGKTVNINWKYEEEDEDMLETGEDFQELIEMSFTFVNISNKEA